MKGFVYSQKNVSLDHLKNLLENLATEPSYYFLRFAHAVSGICMKLPQEFPSPEGQMFNTESELRWKKQKFGYDVLLLTTQADLGLEEFEKVYGNWEIHDFNAYFYKNETKFPNSFIFKGLNDENIDPEDIHIGQRYFKISQRYFKDTDTATVHFIALTVKEK